MKTEARVGESGHALDHFAPLRALRPRWLGWFVWLAATGLGVLVAFAAVVGAVSIVGTIFAAAYRAGVPSLTTSDADVELAKAALPYSAIVAGVSGAALAIACPVLAWLLRRVDPGPDWAPRRGKPRRRQTRRAWDEQVARQNRIGLVCVAISSLVAGIIISVIYSFAPWESGVSVLGRTLRALGSLAAGIVALMAVFMFCLAAHEVTLMVAEANSFFAERAWKRREDEAHETTATAPPPAPEAGGAGTVAATPLTDSGPSPSLLVYLFASLLLPPDSAVRLPAPVPCSSDEVKMTNLASTALAVAFWALRERGFIDLLPSDPEGIRRRRSLDVRRVRVSGATGLAAVILRAPTIDLDAIIGEDTSRDLGPLGPVHKVAGHWLGVLDDPEWKVVEALLEEAVLRGVARRNHGDANGVTLRIDCYRRARLRRQFELFEATWRASRIADPGLHTMLEDECRRALRRARAHPDEEPGRPIRFALAWIAWGLGRAKMRPWPLSSMPPAGRPE